MPISNGKTPTKSPPPGGTPRGNTFISAALACWWQWAQKYLGALSPAKKRAALDFGSAYHAVLEGQDIESIRAWAPEYADEAKALAERRLKTGAPLPPASAIEEAHDILGGLMTSKPDREEKGSATPAIRDHKTTTMYTKHDDAYWNVEPGIIGEMLAADVQRAYVDVMRKGDGNGKDADARVFVVELTPEKAEALRGMVEDFWRQLLLRLDTAKARGVKAAFPKNLKACVGKYGPCDYYDKCWGKGLTSFAYRREEGYAFPWAKKPVVLDGKKQKLPDAKTLRELGDAVVGATRK